jgi:Na+/H+ antiporter NhaD/arsenite permease-like protein
MKVMTGTILVLMVVLVWLIPPAAAVGGGSGVAAALTAASAPAGPAGGHGAPARPAPPARKTGLPAFWIATAVLIAVYILIAFEFMHRTLAALLGASLLLTITYTAGTFFPGYFIISFQDAMKAIDLNVIFLLMSMMIIVGVMKKTGVFQWIAFKAYQVARGNVYVLCLILQVITAVISAFLDNVTTMLLIFPVTLQIAYTLKINPLMLLIPETFASNVGGTATLIGDPPNIMIGSYANLTFTDFLIHLSVICAICLAVTAFFFLFWFRKEYQKAKVEDLQTVIDQMKVEYRITNKKLLTVSGLILGTTIFMFVIHGLLKMEPSRRG